MRRHRNKIRCIKDSVGNWILDDLEVKDHIKSRFQRLYSTESSFSPINSDVSMFACSFLSEEDSTRIETEVTEEEIRTGLWSLKAFKAPGPDGLHVGFFQHFWVDVKNSVCNEIKEVFIKEAVPSFINETLVTLIPKCQSPETLNNYRPISLCNSVYKIISKIIVAHIRSLLTNLISPVQSTFVLGRRGLDNTIIAQELFHSIDGKKGKMGFMAIKLDLEKAYDRLEWNFIHKVLQAFHFPPKLTRVIMSCISSTNISILVNGGMLEPFEPSRGIRQGDPLSPYIFILCMEYLSHLIEQKCVEGSWIPLKASRDNLGFSHLLFADDIILFCKVGHDACDAISDVLNKFFLESGQKISLEKSRIYFSPNVKKEERMEVCDLLGIQETRSIGKYLGFPLWHKGANRRQYNFVVERVMNKLSGWKAKFLSFAGRAVLIKSVMSAIPNHIMQGVALPTHICDKLDKVNWDFLWGSTSEKRKLHLVGWSKIVKPKEDGGLGIQVAKAKNLALLAKLNWRMYQEKDALWAQVILKKYCSLSRVRARDSDALPSSPNWKTIKVGFTIFSSGICWCVGTGARTKVWLDRWLKGESLREMIQGPLSLRDNSLTVEELRDVGAGNGI